MLNESIVITEEDAKLAGKITVPKGAIGVVLICSVKEINEEASEEIEHYLIEELYDNKIACVNVDLISSELNKSSVPYKEEVFNIELLSERAEMVLDWLKKHRILGGLPVGICARHTAAAAAFSAASRTKESIAALVSLGGRLDMVQKYLPYISAPSLLIALKGDELSVQASSNMLEYLSHARLHVIDDKDHSFKGEKAKEEALPLCARWFRRYFNKAQYEKESKRFENQAPALPFYDRNEAAHYLARELKFYQNENPLILAIPRAAVEMADVIATELDCDMDVILVKKLELKGPMGKAYGSVNEFGDVYISGSSETEEEQKLISQSAKAAQERLRDYRKSFGSHRVPSDYEGRTVIIVDDGIVSGATMLSAVVTVKEKGASKVIVASPIVTEAAKKMLTLASDEVVFLKTPESFYSVSQFYQNYPRIGDQEVEQILR